MAQTVKLKRTSVAGRNPTTSNIEVGELAFNSNDKSLFIRGDSSAIVTLHDESTLHIDHTNNRVGIGQTSPSQKLEVSGGNIQITNASGGSYFKAVQSTNGANAGFYMASGSSNWYTLVDTSGRYQIYDGDAAAIRMLVDGAGKVGIGTTSPEHSLHVYDSGSTSSGTIKLGGSAASLGLEMSYTQAGDTTARILANPTYTNDGALLKIAVDGDRNANQLVLDGTGNIGIGTASPEGLFHLKSSSDYEVVFDRTGQEKFKIRHGSSGLYLTGPDTSTLAFGVDQNHDTRMFNTSGVGFAMFKASTSRVGIGTDSPSAKLDVNGTIRTNLIQTRDTSLSAFTFIDLDMDTGASSGTNNLVLGGVNNVDFLIDTNNNSTSSSFVFGTDANTMGSATELMRLTETGRLGIGTDSPLAKLNVKGTQGQWRIDPDSVSSEVQALITNTANSGFVDYRLRTNQFIVDTNGSERLKITTGGAVTFNEAYTFPTADGSANQVLKTDGSGNLTFATVSGGGAVTSISDSDGDTKIQVEESSDEDKIRFDAAGVERFRIGSDIEVIGTTDFNITGASRRLNFTSGTGTIQTTTSNSLALATNSTNRLTISDTAVSISNTINYFNVGGGSGGTGTSIDNAGNISTDGNLTVGGNLTVNGTQTTLNTATLDVEDLNITVAKGASNSAAANGAGLTVDCGSDTDTTFTYNGSSGQWETNTELVIKPRHTGGTPPTLTLTDLNNQYQAGIVSSGHLTMRASGSGNLYWQNGGTYLMMLTNDGDLSIGNGTTAPTNHRVHIKTAVDDSVSQGLVIERSANTDRGYINYQGGGFQFRSTVGDPINLGETDAVHMRINPGGNVGIGTTSPAGNLHIKSVGNAGDAILIVEADNDNNVETDNPRIELRQDGNLVAGYIYMEGTAGATATGTIDNSFVLDGKAGSSNNGSPIHFATGGLAPNQSGGPTNSTVRMTVHEQGNVGIGDTAPAHKLTVASANNTTAVGIDIGSNASYNFQANSTSGYSTTFNMDNSGLEIGHDSASRSLALQTNGTDRLTIGGSGNTTIHNNLDVQGADVTVTANIQHAGDLNTYYGFHGNDLWRVVTGGVERIEVGNTGIRVNDGGNDVDFTIESNNDANMFYLDGGNDRIGIGTSSPNQKLEIKTTSGTAGLRIHADHTSSPRTALEFMRGTTDTFGGDAYTDWKIGHVGNDQADFAIISHDSNRGENERVTVEYTTGNVGIGTNSPNAFLSVRKDNSNSGNQFVVADTEGTSAGVRTYTHGGDDSGLILNHYYAVSGSGNEYMRYADFVANVGNGAGTTMRFITKNAANTYTVGLAQDNNGNVGIGTTTPTEPLTVSKTSSGNTVQIASFVNPVGQANTGVKLWLSGTNTTTRGAYIEAVAGSTANDHSLRFGTSANSATPVEHMRIDKSGSVFIGSISDSGANRHFFQHDGFFRHVRSGQIVGVIDRLTSDGDILKIRKDGSDVGTFGSNAGQFLIDSNASNVVISANSGSSSVITRGVLRPLVDDTDDLGLSNRRFQDLHLSGTANVGGNLVVTGNLTVNGTSTTLNVATLDIEDKNITLNKGSGDTSSTADGAGITIQDAVDASTDATFTWNTSNDTWNLSHTLNVPRIIQTSSVGSSFYAASFTRSSSGTTTPDIWGNNGTLVLGTSSSDERLALTTSGAAVIGNLTTTGDIVATGDITTGTYKISDSSTTTSATTQTTIDTFTATAFRSCRYTVQVTNSTDSTYHTTELLLVHDGTTANITEFGEIFTGAATEATFDADISSGNVRLRATPASTDSMTFKVVRHGITT